MARVEVERTAGDAGVTLAFWKRGQEMGSVSVSWSETAADAIDRMQRQQRLRPFVRFVERLGQRRGMTLLQSVNLLLYGPVVDFYSFQYRSVRVKGRR